MGYDTGGSPASPYGQPTKAVTPEASQDGPAPGPPLPFERLKFQVEWVKFAIDTAIKVCTLSFFVTGGALTIYCTNRSLPGISGILLIPFALAAVLVILARRCIDGMDCLESEIETAAKECGLRVIPWIPSARWIFLAAFCLLLATSLALVALPLSR